MKNKQNLVNWVIDIHNIVNKEQGKPIIEHDDGLLLIFNNFDNSHKHSSQIKENDEIKTSKTSKTSYTIWSLLIVFFILVSIAIIYKKN
jgi:flagellar biosynthesis/type III secretory pathway M-ring protein FliF/YscJ